MDSGTTGKGLAALEADLARDLVWLNHPPKAWVPEHAGPDGQPCIDVLIVGACMNGLCAAFALRRQGITRIRHVDAAEPGREGPWLTYARMEYLRSPKHLTGPAMGLPNLTFRAWWEAQYGPEGWEALGYIRREDWARYLGWYAKVTGAKIENRTRLVSMHPKPGGIEAFLECHSAEETLFARQVVLATGRDGQAKPRIPDAFAPFLSDGVQHSSEALTPARFRERAVVVVGLSASAFDNACVLAEAGAEVTVLGRAAEIPTVNKMKQTVYAGFAQGFPDLPDAERVAWLRYVAACRTAPPRHTVQRAARAGVRIELGVETQTVERSGEMLRLETTRGGFEASHVVLGTGFRFDLNAEPALAAIANQILRWRDLPGAEEGAEDEYLECPALGPGFEFRARKGVHAPGLGRIRCFTHAAQPSLGNLANDIPQASEGAERLARAVARDLFVEDAAFHRQALEAYAEL
ncbi:MAG: NAD(P)/FAD-dependent oxidoreductase, partial [Pseudomonadota bacterium]